MAKRNHPDVPDGALNVIKNNVTRMVACSAEPTTYTEANATFMLANVTMATGDFTLANGDAGGNTSRKVTVAAKTAVSITNSGTANHVALLDVTNSKVLEVTTCTAQTLTASSTVNFPAWKIEFAAVA